SRPPGPDRVAGAGGQTPIPFLTQRCHRRPPPSPPAEESTPMKAVAVLPGKSNSVHLRDIPAPTLDDQPHPHVCRIPEGRAVLVKVLQVGVDATDREINEALYGNAPPGGDYLVIGHEVFGQVAAVGNRVTEVRPGEFVSCTVRRPGKSLYDLI